MLHNLWLVDAEGKLLNLGDKVEAVIKGKWITVQGTIKYFPKYGLIAIEDGNTGKPIGRSGSSTKYQPYMWNAYTNVKVIS